MNKRVGGTKYPLKRASRHTGFNTRTLEEADVAYDKHFDLIEKGYECAMAFSGHWRGWYYHYPSNKVNAS